MPLLFSRRLLPLLVTQTLGAVADNLVRNALVVLILFRAGQSGAPVLVPLATGLFILPYAVLSATAGQIAERWDKSRLILLAKGCEGLLMMLAAIGFLWANIPLLFAVLLGLGIQATFFGPLKYGILPAHLGRRELVSGNGLMEAGTFGGILAGTIAGSALFDLPHGPAVVSVAGLAVSVAGLAAAALVPRAPSLTPGLPIDRNPARATRALLADARANRAVWLCLLGLSWFWVVGTTVVTELPALLHDTLHADARVFALMLGVFSIGVGVGSLLCARLLRDEVSTRLVPFAAFGLSVFLLDFGHTASHAARMADVAAVLHSPAGWRMLADLLLLAACGGLYSVPLYATMQDRAARTGKARMVAANNLVNAAAMAAAAVVMAVLGMAGVTPAAILLITAAVNVLVACRIVRILPQDTLRTILRGYFRLCHGVTVGGLENLPAANRRVVFVVNHQSLLDGCFVASFLPGRPMFAVNIDIARRWWARLPLLAVRCFPVDPANPFTTRSMVRVVREGERLVVFPEGRLTTTGGLMKIFEGAGVIADKAGAAIVPVRIDGLQFSRLSRLGGRVPRRWFPPLRMTVLPEVALRVDPALSGHARRAAIGTILQAAMEHAAFSTTPTDHSLFAALLGTKRRHGGGCLVAEDIARKPLSYRKLVLGASVLGRRLAREVPMGGRVGVMLPNANGAVVCFMALQGWGRVPAMLNFSAGAEAMLSACTAAEVTLVLSSRAFVERGKLGPVVERMQQQVRFLWLEDARAEFGFGARLRGVLDLVRADTLPGARVSADAPAVVLFTSGSEGAPKGVVLSHRNILSNIAQVAAVVDFNGADRVLNAMPMFHSFGLTGATLLPLLSGVRTFFYPSPLHYRIVPEIAYDIDATIAFGTDTFLTGWARFAHPYDFYRMRYIFSGAEKVRDETRRLYADTFGVRVLEGYGATETAPVLALNSSMHSRPGSAGRLLPGIGYRLQPVEGIAHGGRLIVRGPNVMLGYLRVGAPGMLEPPEGGWYDTGDICEVDADRFVTILARARRFAKIAGEMVSMPAAETLASTVWPDAAHAVVSVPDQRKGEALVLMTTRADADAGALLTHARSRGAAEIGVPRTIQVVDALPLLGTGKVDYATATRMVVEARTAQTARHRTDDGDLDDDD